MKATETAYACLDAYYHPMLTWSPPKTIIPPFVPPPISLLLPHDLIHLAFLLLWNILFPLGNISPSLLGICLALIHISPPLESNHLKSLAPKGLAKQYSSRED